MELHWMRTRAPKLYITTICAICAILCLLFNVLPLSYAVALTWILMLPPFMFIASALPVTAQYVCGISECQMQSLHAHTMPATLTTPTTPPWQTYVCIHGCPQRPVTAFTANANAVDAYCFWLLVVVGSSWLNLQLIAQRLICWRCLRDRHPNSGAPTIAR